jgi:hypothetical protein
LRTGPCGPHNNKCGRLCRSDSNDTTWFVALIEEQRTATTDYRFHRWLLSRHQLLPGITGATAPDILQDYCRPARESEGAPVSAVLAGPVGPSCLLFRFAAGPVSVSCSAATLV